MRAVRLILSPMAIMTVCMLGCSTGGGGKTTAKEVYRIAANVDASGAILDAPPPFGLRIEFPMHSVRETARVVATLWEGDVLDTSALGLTARSRAVGLEINTEAILPDAQVLITAPFENPQDGSVLCVAAGIDGAPLRAVDSQFNRSTATFTAFLSKQDLEWLAGFSSRQAGSAPVYLAVQSSPPEDETAGVELLRFTRDLGRVDPMRSDRAYWETDSGPWASPRVALVIHGINNQVENMTAMAYYLAQMRKPDGEKLYADVWGADCRFRARISENGAMLAALVGQRLQSSTSRIDVFGHSQGGLIARYALEKRPELHPHVDRLFTFGTPHGGVPGNLKEQQLLAERSDLLRGVGIEDMLQGGANNPPSAFLRALNDSSAPPGRGRIAYITFAGNRWRDYGDPIYVTIRGRRAEIFDSVGQATHRFYVGEDNNQDGIVPVSSAQFKGLQRSIPIRNNLGVIVGTEEVRLSGLDTKASIWVNPSERYCLDHSQMRGEFAPNTRVFRKVLFSAEAWKTAQTKPEYTLPSENSAGPYPRQATPVPLNSEDLTEGPGRQRLAAGHDGAAHTAIGVGDTVQAVIVLSEPAQPGPGTIQVNVIINQIVTDAFPRVLVLEMIRDQNGNPITNLNSTNFEVIEDGRPALITDVRTVVQAATNLSVCMVLDRSGSMDGQPALDLDSAAETFVGLLAPGDTAAIINFDTTVEVTQPFTSDHNLALLAIRNQQLRFGGATALYDAAYRGVQDTAPRRGRMAVIAMTDGEDNSSYNSPEELARYARASGVPIFTVGLGYVSEYYLDYVARETGGHYTFAPSSGELSAIYQKVANQLNGQIQISFISPNPTGAGQRHVIVRYRYGPYSGESAHTYSL